ncbi:hypothetical protein IAD21_02998 [Abditibacteriota bacterium]|nr:hypothetical protein IAD21_02998 [Abditibacteriota bacterium]
MDISEKWGLPPDFTPARYSISDDAKTAVRPVLGANEPVIVSLQNDEELVSILATPGRILTVRAHEIGVGAGTSQVKTFPWPGVFNLTLRPQAFNVSFVIEYRTADNGKTVEIGRRALLGKPKSDILAGFSKSEGEAAFHALVQLWNWKKALLENQE